MLDWVESVQAAQSDINAAYIICIVFVYFLYSICILFQEENKSKGDRETFPIPKKYCRFWQKKKQFSKNEGEGVHCSPW